MPAVFLPFLMVLTLAACGASDPANDGPADVLPAEPADVPPVDVEPADVEPGDAEPIDLEPSDPEPADVEPTDVEPGDVEPTDVEPGDVEPTDVEPTDVEPGDVEPTDVEPADGGPADVELGDAGQPGAEPVDVAPTDAEPATSASPFNDRLSDVVQWNELALASVVATGAKPTATAHRLFLISASMYDAWAIHSDIATPYALDASQRRPAAERTEQNRHEAISQAAYQSLKALYPGVEAENGWFAENLQRLGLEPLDDHQDSAHHDSAAEFGRAAALAVLHDRRDDGANYLGDYAEITTPIFPEPYQPVNTPSSISELGEFSDDFDPNRWQPLRVPNGSLLDDDRLPLVDALNLDSFGDQKFLTPHFGAVTPFALSHGSELRPSPPPMYGSEAPYVDALGVHSTNDEAYRRQFTDVVRFSAELDDRGKVIAEFWADGPRTEAPPGHWNQLAHGLIERDELDQGDTIKLFFALNAGLLDAGITTWEAKRHYDFLRPATAIRFLFGGQTIQSWAGPNRGTEGIDGSEWSPYQSLTFVTPPFPEYVSGHSTFSRASADILSAMLGSDRFYDGESRTLQDVNGDGERDMLGEHIARAGSFFIEEGPRQDVVLRWHTLRDAADEAGLSRLYGGIHIQDGDLRGRQLGANVAQRVIERARRYFDGEAVH